MSENKELQEKVNKFPQKPGVYLMSDEKGKVLYVGKAKQLKNRVSSYFGKSADDRYQIKFLMKKVKNLDFIVTDNEKEALLLEDILIKKHMPKYNVVLRDDKTYVSLAVNVQHQFPRVYRTRKINQDGTRYFGPYSDAFAIYKVLQFIEKYFRIRTCSENEFNHRSRPCLQYQIKRCDAPCVGLISEKDYGALIDQMMLFLEGRNLELKKQVQEKMWQASEGEHFEAAAQYRDLLQDMDKLLEKQKVIDHQGENKDVIHHYREGSDLIFALMEVREGKLQNLRTYAFQSVEEEEALYSHFLIQYYHHFIPREIHLGVDLESKASLEEILSDRAKEKIQILHPQKGEKARFLQMALENAQEAFKRKKEKMSTLEERLLSIQKSLKLDRLPRKIECYDISNFQGKESVASQVTFLNGEPYKKSYKRFKIKTVIGANDFASLYETISRRLKQYQDHPDDPNWELPDLIVIDGGIGQLNAALSAVADREVLGLNLVGLAKSRNQGDNKKSDERIFLPNRKNPLVLKQNSHELFILTHLRDEAHRFGIEYHRKLRGKKSIQSKLDEVPGLGVKRKQMLLKVFKSIDGIKGQSAEVIHQETKIPLKLAQEVLDFLE